MRYRYPCSHQAVEKLDSRGSLVELKRQEGVPLPFLLLAIGKVTKYMGGHVFLSNLQANWFDASAVCFLLRSLALPNAFSSCLLAFSFLSFLSFLSFFLLSFRISPFLSLLRFLLSRLSLLPAWLCVCFVAVSTRPVLLHASRVSEWSGSSLESSPDRSQMHATV